MKNLIYVFLTIFLFFSSACQTAPVPIEDYSLARAAMEAARVVQAARYSPSLWHQAEEAYRKGKIYYEDRDYGRAKEQFVRARVAAERAELSARLTRQKTGDIL